MKTGEGKTLVSTLPAYLNGLSGDGSHLITVNDYLARRDSEWMGRLHRWLGLSVGLIVPGDFDAAYKREQYAADITYGTNNEFGFDYLRDNMAMSRERQVQRGHHYAIVDEVDSILIDEARTPLIISGRVADAAQLYYKFASIVRGLRRDEDYEVDEQKRTVSPTEDGIEKVEQALGIDNLYDGVAQNLVHQLQAALRAKELFKRDKDYIIASGEVKIVDEFTGRILEGRRWSEGLHQAVEAKEGVKIKEENQTLATVTLQNYFRMYEKLAGMTGTALTEAAEFANTYDLQVVPVPTNRANARADQADLIYKSEDGKFHAVVDDIAERYAAGQPVLVGTISVEKSEKLSRLLDKRGIAHEVLNAKQHTREAEIVAQAGRLQAVTVATNMAGRGVDILLGGNPEGLALRDLRAQGLDLDVARGRGPARPAAHAKYLGETQAEGDKIRELGGLYVLGTERHESRRIDNQLRGRAGRQGDPGESRFYLSLEDDLMRLFATGRHQLGDGQGPPRRHAPRGEDGLEGDRAGADHRRAEERRDPQERPQVRRGPQRAAQGDLRAARPDPRQGRPAASASSPSTCRRPSRPSSTRTAWPTTTRSGTSRACTPTCSRTGRARSPWRSWRGRHQHQGPLRAPPRRRRGALRGPRGGARRGGAPPGRAPGDAPHHRHAAGASTSTRWTTCRRASTCGPWASATRSPSGSARASRCSAR